MTIESGYLVEKGGRKFRVNVERDDKMREPWAEHAGHGIVSETVSRDKRPGERILYDDGRLRQFYDVQATVRLAARDGWGLSEDGIVDLSKRIGRNPTKREITAYAVQRDYENLRAWCDDKWCWCGVVVTDITDDSSTDTDYENALWGIESNSGEYLETVAHELVDEILSRRKAEQEKAKIESRFTDAMNCGI